MNKLVCVTEEERNISRQITTENNVITAKVGTLQDIIETLKEQIHALPIHTNSHNYNGKKRRW